MPALTPAVLTSQSGHVAVLATKATLNGTLLNQVIADIAVPNHTTVTKYFDPALVPWVEAGMPKISDTAKRLRQQVQEFADDNVDCLVLGCTHYPFFKDFLMDEMEALQLSIQIVDSGHAIAARVQSLLASRGLLAAQKPLAQTEQTDSPHDDRRYPLTFYASKYDHQLNSLVQRLLGARIQIQYVNQYDK